MAFKRVPSACVVGLSTDSVYCSRCIKVNHILNDKFPLWLKNKPVVVKDDLQKARWGGKSVNNGKRIKASVSPNKWQKFFDVTIEISMEDGAPLNSPVAIFVHDTYKLPDDVIYVKPDVNGMVKQTLIAYEAFTV